MSEAAVAKAEKSTAYTAVCGRFRVSQAEGFVIFSQFCQPRLRQGETALASHVLNRHDAKANHWGFMSAGGLMKRLGNLVVRPAEVEDVIALDVASSGGGIQEVAMADEEATAVLVDEWMVDCEQGRSIPRQSLLHVNQSVFLVSCFHLPRGAER